MSDILDPTATIADIRQRALEKARRIQCKVEISASSSPHGFQWTVMIGFYDSDPWGTGKFKATVGEDENLAVAAQKCLDKLKPEPDLSEYTGPWTPESARARVGGTMGT